MALIVFFILFQNILLRPFSAFGVINYWDEAAFMLVALWYIVGLVRRRMDRDEAVYLLVLIGFCLVGLAGDLFFGFQPSVNAIVRDIVGFLKFPLSLLAFYHISLTDRLADGLCRLMPLLRVLVWVILFFGVVSLFFDLGMSQPEYRAGVHPYMFLYTHPTYLTTSMICLLCLFNATGDATPVYDFALLSIIILGLRTKGLVFVAVYLFMKYAAHWFKHIRLLYFGGIALMVAAVSYNKMALYASFSNSPRESMYGGALRLIGMCFPLGSGFGSFASSVSGDFLSRVYEVIPIAGMYESDGSVSVVIGDAGLAYYLGQFGLLGIVLFGLLTYCVLRLTTRDLLPERRFPVMALWMMIAITLTTEMLLVGNGFEMAMLLAVSGRVCLYRQQDRTLHGRRPLVRVRLGTDG